MIMDYEGVTPMLVGYLATVRSVPKRFESQAFTHGNHF
jgi:hypothetical protein